MPSLDAKVEPTAKQALFPAHASLKRRSQPYRGLAAWLDNEKITARSQSNRPVLYVKLRPGVGPKLMHIIPIRLPMLRIAAQATVFPPPVSL